MMSTLNINIYKYLDSSSISHQAAGQLLKKMLHVALSHLWVPFSGQNSLSLSLSHSDRTPHFRERKVTVSSRSRLRFPLYRAHDAGEPPWLRFSAGSPELHLFFSNPTALFFRYCPCEFRQCRSSSLQEPRRNGSPRRIPHGFDPSPFLILPTFISFSRSHLLLYLLC